LWSNKWRKLARTPVHVDYRATTINWHDAKKAGQTVGGIKRSDLSRSTQSLSPFRDNAEGSVLGL
jgi:hypothetical protein